MRTSLRALDATAGAVALLLAALALAGCRDNHAPRWREVCTRSHTETTMQVMPAVPGVGIPLGGGISLVPTEDDVCDAQEIRCDLGGGDYLGPRVCPARAS